MERDDLAAAEWWAAEAAREPVLYARPAAERLPYLLAELKRLRERVAELEKENG